MLQSLGCVQDPAWSPWGSELGLDLASVPQGLDNVFWGTQWCRAGLCHGHSTGHWGTAGTDGGLKAARSSQRGCSHGTSRCHVWGMMEWPRGKQDLPPAKQCPGYPGPTSWEVAQVMALVTCP